MQDIHVVVSPPNIIHVAQKDIYVRAGNAVYVLDEDACKKVYTSQDALSIYAIVKDNRIYVNAQDIGCNRIQAFDMNKQRVLWSYTLETFSEPFLRVENDFVYICEGKRIIALHTSDGKLVWSCDIGGTLSPLSIVKDNTLYVASKDEINCIYAIDSHNGFIKWHTPLTFLPTTRLGAPLVCKQSVIVSSQFGCTAFSSSYGTPIWQYDAPIVEMIGAGNGKVCLGYPLQKNPTIRQVDMRTTVFFEKKQCVCMLNDVDGTLLWKSELELEEDVIRKKVVTSPVVADGIAYVVIPGIKGSSLAAFQAENGMLLWRYQSDEVLFSTPWVEGHIIYVGSNDGNISAIEVNGTFLWKMFVATSSQIGIGSTELKLI